MKYEAVTPEPMFLQAGPTLNCAGPLQGVLKFLQSVYRKRKHCTSGYTLHKSDKSYWHYGIASWAVCQPKNTMGAAGSQPKIDDTLVPPQAKGM